MRVVSRIGSVDKRKNSAAPQVFRQNIRIRDEKMASTILSRFRAMAARKHSSIAA